MSKQNPIKKANKRRSKLQKGSTSHKILIIILCVLILILLIGLLYQQYPDLFSRHAKNSKPIVENIDTVKTEKKGRAEKKRPTPSKKRSEKKNPTQPQKMPESQPTQPQTEETTRPTSPKSEESYFDIRQIRGFDIPNGPKSEPSQIIFHIGYTLSYNKDWRIANWVGYELTRQETYGNEKRTNKFVVDPKVVGNTATDSDYRGSGYDRGHMAPAADMTWNKDAMRESFYFSNMTPQDPSLNRGIWKKLEEKVRYWAQRDRAIYIICGPVYKGDEKKIGRNQVMVPDQLYKVILSPYGKKVKAIGFLFKNEGSLESLKKFAVSVDSIEKLTGIDFFYQLPDSMERSVESTVNLNDWF